MWSVISNRAKREAWAHVMVQQEMHLLQASWLESNLQEPYGGRTEPRSTSRSLTSAQTLCYIPTHRETVRGETEREGETGTERQSHRETETHTEKETHTHRDERD